MKFEVLKTEKDTSLEIMKECISFFIQQEVGESSFLLRVFFGEIVLVFPLRSFRIVAASLGALTAFPFHF